jgi:hypothetical protein
MLACLLARLTLRVPTQGDTAPKNFFRVRVHACVCRRMSHTNLVLGVCVCVCEADVGLSNPFPRGG